jgi:hypothetical protein
MVGCFFKKPEGARRSLNRFSMIFPTTASFSTCRTMGPLSRELELGLERLPILKRIGMHTFFNGPDELHARWSAGAGRGPDPAQFLRCSRFNSIGIQTAGGAGKAIAEWMRPASRPLDTTGRHPPLPAVPRQRHLSWPTASAKPLGLHYADISLPQP